MDTLSALADPIRRRIVELLADEARDAGSLAADFDVSRPAVSRHLRVLRESGLVAVRREGTRRIYELRVAPLQELDAWLARYRSFWSDRLDTLEAAMERQTRSKEEQ